MADLRHALEEMRLAGELVAKVTSWRITDPRPAVYGETPPDLDPRLAALLATRGIERLYVHQSIAVRQVLDGRNVVVVTPTASGKTLCYNLPVLNTLLRVPEARALYIFPTKALAHDQLHTLQEYTSALGMSALIAAYDGDTPRGRRAHIRRSVNVLFTNPDMLHVGILPRHPQWRGFFSGLCYVVIDEMHSYRGVFGSHVANVLRRLKRICRFYGSQPQFICCSATIANPLDLAEKLIEEPVVLVSRNGAPRAERTTVFCNPPIVNDQLGLRRSALLEARDLANRLLDNDVQTVIFCRSRRAVERLVLSLRQDARRDGRDPGAIRGYRGGYLPRERREIEGGLREGTVRGVVATSALELGVDIGELSACIMAGYPGTIASTWQRMGRAGRGREESAAFLVASSSPLDQYIVSHPDYFFGESPEHALINPDNLYVLLDHVRCAVFELPFADGEAYGSDGLGDILGFLEAEGLVHESRERWHWVADAFPAGDTSLRSLDSSNVAIIAIGEGDERTVIGELEREVAPVWLHEGAIYLHEGQQYRVASLDWDGGIAMVERVEVDYYTEASSTTRIEIERVLAERRQCHFDVARGEVTLTTRATGYRRLRLGSMDHLGWGDIDLPEQQMVTTACWITVPEEVVSRLRDEGCWVGDRHGSRGPNWAKQRDLARRRDGYRCRWCNALERPGRQHDVHHVVPFGRFRWVPGQNENYRSANHLSNLVTLCAGCHRLAEQQVAVQSTLSGLGRVFGHLIPLVLMCGPRDVGVQSDVQAPQTHAPTLFVYDRIPGGIGLSEEVFDLCSDLLDKAVELVRDCRCAAGCPSCIGPEAAVNSRSKEQVVRLASAMRA